MDQQAHKPTQQELDDLFANFDRRVDAMATSELRKALKREARLRYLSWFRFPPPNHDQ